MATDSSASDHSGQDYAGPSSSEGLGGEDRIERTIRWYDRRAEEYAEWTRQIDLSGLRERFLRHVPEGGNVLDVGCGAGRDAKAFLEEGYKVTALDASEGMARLASEYIGRQVHHCRVQDFEPEGAFNGIWACASLLHIPEAELPAVFERLAGWLRPGGVLYASFYAGERSDTERFFNEVSRAEVTRLLEDTDGLEREEVWRSGDAEGREDVEWVNALARPRDLDR